MKWILASVSVVGFILSFTVDWREFYQWLRPQKAQIPTLDYVINLQHRYKPGLQIDGVIWQKNYREYLVEVLNKSHLEEIYDLTVDMYFPGSVIKHSVLKNIGIDHLNITDGVEMPVFKKQDIVQELLKYNSNRVIINSTKVSRNGVIEIKLLIFCNPKSQNTENDGFFSMKYAYKQYGDREDLKLKERCHRIIVVDDQAKNLLIDKSNVLLGDVTLHLRLRLKETFSPGWSSRLQGMSISIPIKCVEL